MTSIKIEKLSFSIGNKQILDNINFEIQTGEFFLLLGPSGCGKTTLLRLIAGFYQPQSGELFFNQKQITDTPPQNRNIGMVFQSYALFPHMTVAQNVEYGLKIRDLSKEERKKKINQVLDVVQLSGYESRLPGSLSGGEQQRVALARALAIEPDILLLDEPLSNLDAKLRIQMRQELREIHQHTKVTTIYVTHDQEEALSMADRIAVMNNGRILQIGSPDEIYYHPANSFVAGFIGEANIFFGRVQEIGKDSQVILQAPFGKLTVDKPNILLNVKTPVTCCVRPEAIQIIESPIENVINQFQAIVTDTQFRGESMHLLLQLDSNTQFHAVYPKPKKKKIQRNQNVTISISPSDILIL